VVGEAAAAPLALGPTTAADRQQPPSRPSSSLGGEDLDFTACGVPIRRPGVCGEQPRAPVVGPSPPCLNAGAAPSAPPPASLHNLFAGGASISSSFSSGTGERAQSAGVVPVATPRSSPAAAPPVALEIVPRPQTPSSGLVFGPALATLATPRAQSPSMGRLASSIGVFRSGPGCGTSPTTPAPDMGDGSGATEVGVGSRRDSCGLFADSAEARDSLDGFVTCGLPLRTVSPGPATEALGADLALRPWVLGHPVAASTSDEQLVAPEQYPGPSAPLVAPSPVPAAEAPLVGPLAPVPGVYADDFAFADRYRKLLADG